MTAILTFCCFVGFARRLTTPQGKRVEVRGTGPPVLFSSGLYGTMPHWAYSSFLNKVRKRLSIVHVDGVVGAAELEDLADALGVRTMGAIVHSAVRRDLIASPRLCRAVLLDPVAVPWPFASNQSATPALVVRAERSYNARVPFVPPPLALEPPEGAVTVFQPGVGHSDILDDMWADLADRIGIRGARSEQPAAVEYAQWSAPATEADPRARRLAYRDRVATMTVEFLA